MARFPNGWDQSLDPNENAETSDEANAVYLYT